MLRARLTILLALALFLSACGGSGRHFVIGTRLAHITPPRPTALRFSTASNRRFAQQDVLRLMRILELPPGARRVTKVPTSAPPRFRNDLTRARFMRGIAVTHRIWIVHEPLDRVVRFVRAHAHPKPRPDARFRGENDGVRIRAVGSYAFPPVPGRSWERWLNVDMVARSGGGTAVIAQTGDAWVRTPRRSLLPHGVKRIDVVSRVGKQPPRVLARVRKPYDVGWIVALVNGLSRADPAQIACHWAFSAGGPTVTLRFRAANGRLLARATVLDLLGRGVSGPCNPLQVSVRSQKAVPLIGADLVLRIQRLLDVHFAAAR